MDTWIEFSFTTGVLKADSVALVSIPAQDTNTAPIKKIKATNNASLFFIMNLPLEKEKRLS
jgi:hypothetical protein